MSSNNPLLNDDDDDDFITPSKPSEADFALPSLSDEMPSLGDFALPPRVNEHQDSIDEYDENNTYSSHEADEDEDDYNPIAGILDSLDDFDSLLSMDDDEPEFDGKSPQEKFEDQLGLRDDDDDDDYLSEPIIDLDKIIAHAIEVGASDIHISPDDEIAYTVLGSIQRASDFGLIDGNMTVKLQQDIISYVLEQSFVEELELDTSYVVKTGSAKGRRLRLSVGKTDNNVFMVFRIIADTMPTPAELDIPKQMQEWVNLPAGLILVNGPTGSGKSTTLSSLVQEIQFTRAEKVITIEKPVEFVYTVKEGQKAFITQREVGKDARSFASALTSAMRQAPNIILVGEVRNREEIDELLRAAETGHLAISTLHTTSCPATINRIRSMYEGDEQLRVLATLADNLRGLMTQTLVKSPDGTKRLAVREVLQINAELKDYVLKGDVHAMRQYQEDHGITMEHELVKAVEAGKADLNSARAKAPNPMYFDELLDL